MTEGRRCRIVLIDDHVLFRETLAQTLDVQPDLAVAGQFSSVYEAAEFIRTEAVDLVLLDINLGREQGGGFLALARAAGFRGKVLVVTAGVSDREAAWLLHRGCAGIFLKTQSTATLLEQIRTVMSGEYRLDAVSVKAVVKQLQEAESAVPEALTPRENTVLRCVCEGLSNKEIAERLSLSESSVKNFLQQLFHKSGVRTRAQLVRVAIERYWDQLDGA